MLGGVVRTLTLGPRLIQSLLLLPKLLRRLETNRSIRLLAEATQPLGRLAGRLPGGRRGETLP
jgi:hypothetical protein